MSAEEKKAFELLLDLRHSVKPNDRYERVLQVYLQHITNLTYSADPKPTPEEQQQFQNAVNAFSGNFPSPSLPPILYEQSVEVPESR